MKDNDIVITSAFRSPIGTYKGSLSGLSAVELGSKVIEKCLKDSNLGPDDVDTLLNLEEEMKRGK